MDPQALAQLQAQIDANPEIQAALRHPGRFDRYRAIMQAASRSGIQIPHGYTLDMQSGRVVEDHGLRNNLLAGAAVLGGPLAIGLLGPMAGAAGSGGMAAENVAPFAGLPGAFTAEGTLASAPIGTGAMAGMPSGGSGALAGAGGGSVPSGVNAASSVPGWLETALKVAPVGAGLINHFANGGGSGGPAGQMSPELQQLLQMSMKRMQDQEPLFQAVSRQAYEGLPTYAKGK